MSAPVMPVMPYKRVEVWTDTVTNGGTRASQVPVVAATLTEEITNSLVVRRLALTTFRYTDVADLVVKRVLRITWSDDTYLELRISEKQDASGSDGLVRLTALDLIYDLGEGDALVSQVVNNVVQYAFEVTDQFVDLINDYGMAVAPSYIPTGTSGSSGVVSLAANKDTPLSFALKGLHAAEVSTGAYYELYLIRNGITQYEWTIGQFNNAVALMDARTAKNLLGTQRRTQRLGNFTNRIIPFGSDGGTHGGAWWKITAVSVNTYIEITDISGSGVNPILADDQFNGKYWIHEDGTTEAIADTVKASKRLLMADTTGMAVGEWGRLAENVGGDFFAYLDNPSSQTSYGLRMGTKTFDSPTHTNWAKNANFADWTGSLPTDWTSPSFSDPNASTTVGTYETGGRSAHFDHLINADLQSTRDVYCVAGESITYSVRVKIVNYLTAGGTAFIQLRDPQAGTTTDFPVDGSISGLDTLGEFITFTRTYLITSTGVKTCTVYLRGNLHASIDFYVDSVSITKTTAAVDFVNGSGAATVWLKAVQYMELNNQPPVSYEIRLIDLYRLDPVLWASEALSLGGYVQLTDTELGLTGTLQLRVLKVESNLLNPSETKLTLASNAEQFTRLLTAA